MSHDGRFAITLIGLLGSVFSPFYAAARRSGQPASPLDHCSMNVALYGPRSQAFCFTERGARSVAREPEALALGPSSMRWERGAFVAEFDERTAVFGAPVRGRVRLVPTALSGDVIELDAAGRHRWCAIAPHAHVEVELSRPALRWTGIGYLDSNGGDEGLEDAFESWDWSRTASAGEARVTYDLTRRDGSRLFFSRSFEKDGRAIELSSMERHAGPRTLWGLERTLHAAPEERASVVETLEDGPFYARSLVRIDRRGPASIGTHETLDLDRFRNPWVQRMLPYRMRQEIG
ncbi:MAG: carotenoid 1,2-hydratase [Byssovorax sp.]